MKYNDSQERSAELLRMALPLMSRQAAALHPISYAVWYEYVGQGNLPLRAAVDDELRRHGQLDEARTHALHRQHVAEIDSDAARRVADGFDRVLSGMSESATRAGDQTARYGVSLERLRESLASDACPVIDEVMAHTREMQRSVQHLQQQLAESRHEIEDLRCEVRSARRESLVDALTGLPNRRAFDQRLATALLDGVASTPAAGSCLIVTDIDHFKRINDSYGHGFGDHVLKAVAEVLRVLVPEPGLVARIGGEEFALLLPATPVEQAAALAERIRATIAASRVRRGPQQLDEHVTVSVGVAAARAGELPQQLLERADAAMYASKRGGRDRVCLAVCELDPARAEATS